MNLFLNSFIFYYTDDYARKLFRKECFVTNNYFFDNYKDLRSISIIKTLKHAEKLRSTISRVLSSLRQKINERLKRKKQFALRVVPLPDFTAYDIEHEENALCNKVLNIFLFIFIPRWYKTSRKEKYKLSPFARMTNYARSSDDMYDNPAIQAVIDFRWKRKARTFFIIRALLFLIFRACFGYISWAFINRDKESPGFLVASMVIFYYLAIYQIATEFMQFLYRGFRRYFGNMLNWVDLISIIIPVVVISFMLRKFRSSNGFESVEEVNAQFVALISISIFVIWIEAVSIILFHSDSFKVISFVN